MPMVTGITEQKRRPNRRNVFLDGTFAFGCKLNVIARFRLREGLDLSREQVQQIEQGEIRQDCLDSALKFLERRLHSRFELDRKLTRQQFSPPMIEDVLEELARLGYVDDLRFAQTRATSALQHKHHGRRRAKMELFKAGIKTHVAERALDLTYGASDPVHEARLLAARQAQRLRRLDPVVARRRLTGMLMRRGFDLDAIRPVLEETFGRGIVELDD